MSANHLVPLSRAGAALGAREGLAVAQICWGTQSTESWCPPLALPCAVSVLEYSCKRVVAAANTQRARLEREGVACAADCKPRERWD